MKNVLSILGTFLLFGMVSMFCSCGSDELSEMDVPQQEMAGWNHAKVKLNIECTGFDQKDGTTRAAGDQWQDGDVVYLLLTDKDGNKVQAYVKYDGSKNEWGDVIYDGYKSYLTCNTQRVAEAYYIEGVSTLSTSSLDISSNKAIYTCNDGSYVYPADGDMTLNVALKPLTGRIRFEGKANATASISGIKTYTAFSTVTGKFTESTTAVNTKVAADGSTPYIYCSFYDAKEPSLIVTSDKTYKTVFDSSSIILLSGKSGFMRLPTVYDHRGWDTVVPVSDVTITPSTLTIEKGHTSVLSAKVLPEDASDKVLTWTSSNNAVATVDNKGNVNAIADGTTTITATSLFDRVKKATCTITVFDANGHSYVDLGLTSGTLWATMNVGATNISDYGDYIAWGETTGYNDGKTSFSWSTYKLCNGSSTTLTKYCCSQNLGVVDNMRQLEKDDDAAHTNWGGSWVMPTNSQYMELESECTWSWDIVNTVKGYVVTSKKNGNSIFFPAAGYRNTSLYSTGSRGGYWSNTSCSGPSDFMAFGLFFESSNTIIYPSIGGYRYTGQSIRPVMNK